MLGGIVHGDGDGDAGNVGKATAGILMVVILEDVVHDELQAASRNLLVMANTVSSHYNSQARGKI